MAAPSNARSIWKAFPAGLCSNISAELGSYPCKRHVRIEVGQAILPAGALSSAPKPAESRLQPRLAAPQGWHSYFMIGPKRTVLGLAG